MVGEPVGEGDGLLALCLLVGEGSARLNENETRMFALESAGLSNLYLTGTACDYARGYVTGRVAIAIICSLRVLMPLGLSMLSRATSSSCIWITDELHSGRGGHSWQW